MEPILYLFTIDLFITFIKVTLPATINTVHSSHPFHILGKYNQLLEEKNVNAFNLSASDDFRHHDYASMTEFLTMLTYRCRNITRLHSVGESVQRRSLWVMTMANESITQRYSPHEHVPGMLEFKYIGNMHGNEVVSREVLLHFLYLLCVNYGKHELITAILDTTRIHVMPSMNPDGYEIAKSAPEYSRNVVIGRSNAHSMDLNRNFPDRLMTTYENARQEPETLVVMSWLKSLPFVLSANLHGGSVVANYPFDGNKEQKTEYTASPDDDTFRLLALAYSYLHPRMTSPFVCRGKTGDPDNFAPSGITNGAAWYPLSGGMQDWNYMNTNCFELTLEVSCVKFPKQEELPRYWNENRLPLIFFLLQAHKGIHGFITQSNGTGIREAVIEVQGLPHAILSAEYGDYWRLLSPGRYNVTVTKLGFISQTLSTNISKASQDMGQVTNFILSPVDLNAWSKQHNNILENGRLDFHPDEVYRSWSELQNLLQATISSAVTNGEYKLFIRQWQPASFLSVTFTSNKNGSLRRPSIILVGSVSTIESSTMDLSLMTMKYLVQGIKLKDESVLNLLKKVDITILPTVTLNSTSFPNQPENFAERQQCPRSSFTKLEAIMSNISFHLSNAANSASPLVTGLKQLLQAIEPDLLISLHTGGNLWRVSPDYQKGFLSSIQSPWLTHPTSIDGSPGGMKMLLQSLYKSYSQALLSGGFSGQQEVGCYHWRNRTGLWEFTEGADLRNRWDGDALNSRQTVRSAQTESPNALSLLDYAYLKHGTAAVGIHVACCLQPPRISLPYIFRDHLPQLIGLFRNVEKALCGKLILQGKRKLREYEVENIVLQIRGVSWSLKQSSWERLSFCKVLPNEFFEKSSVNLLELQVFNVAGYQSQVVSLNISTWSQHESNIWIDIPLAEKNLSQVAIHSASYYATELSELKQCSAIMKHYGYSISFKTIGYSRLKQKAIQVVVISPLKRSFVYDPVNIHFLGNIHSDSLISAELQWQLLHWFCSNSTMYWIEAGIPTNWYFLTPEGLSPERLDNLYATSQQHSNKRNSQCQTIPTDKYNPPINSIEEEQKIYSDWAIQQSTPLLTVSFIQSNQTFIYSNVSGFISPFSQFRDSFSTETMKNESCSSQLTPQMLSHYTYFIKNMSEETRPAYSSTQPYYVAFSSPKSCCAWLPREQLVDEWIKMKDQLKTFLLYSAVGGKNLVLGRVVSNVTRNDYFSHSQTDEEIRVGGAVITITQSSSSLHSLKVMSSDTRGSFAILLAPGTYQLSVTSEGHALQNQTFTLNGIRNRPLELVIRLAEAGNHAQDESKWSVLSKNMFPLLLVLCISGFLLLLTVLMVILNHQGCCAFIRNKAVVVNSSRIRMKGVRYQPVAISENTEVLAPFIPTSSAASHGTASVYNEQEDGINVLPSATSRRPY